MTFKLDNSEVSWLVYADWLEDQGSNGQDIRDLIYDYKIYSELSFDLRSHIEWEIDHPGAGSKYINGSRVGPRLHHRQVGGLGRDHVGSFYLNEVGYGSI